jgi:hypothetical protein
MNERLHADRLTGPGVRRTHQAPLDTLPDGTMIELDGAPWLVLGGRLLAWSHGGYHKQRDRPASTEVTVLTPRATVAVLAAGYQPALHSSAGRNGRDVR